MKSIFATRVAVVANMCAKMCTLHYLQHHQDFKHYFHNFLGHKHRVRAIRRGIKTNQAVLSPSSSLLTSSTSVSEMSYTGTTSGGSSLMSNSPSNNLSNAISSSQDKPANQSLVSSSGKKSSSQKNSNSPGDNHLNKKADKSSNSTGTMSGGGGIGKTRIRERRSSTKMVKKSAIVSSHSDSSTTSQTHQNQNQKQKPEKKQPVNALVSSNKKDDKQSSMALSRHRSSGCLQSRHCHSTLSLSRARSSSALNRVQSRSMNLLMIQNNSVNNNKHGMKNTSSDVLSMASSSSSSSSSSSANEMVDDEEEDEGVATDATADNGNSNNISTAKKDIKSATKSRSAPHRNIRINQEDGLAKGKLNIYFFLALLEGVVNVKITSFKSCERSELSVFFFCHSLKHKCVTHT